MRVCARAFGFLKAMADNPVGLARETSEGAGQKPDASAKPGTGFSVAAEEADEVGLANGEEVGEFAGGKAAGEPEIAEAVEAVGIVIEFEGPRGAEREQVFERREELLPEGRCFLLPQPLAAGRACGPFPGVWVAGRFGRARTLPGWQGQSEEAKDLEARLGGGLALGAFKAVELAGGEVEEVGGFLEGEVVLEAEGAQALGEVSGRAGGDDESEEGVAVVGGEFVAPGTGVFLRRLVEEEGGVEIGEQVVGVGKPGGAGERFSKSVRGQEKPGQSKGDAGR